MEWIKRTGARGREERKKKLIVEMLEGNLSRRRKTVEIVLDRGVVRCYRMLFRGHLGEPI